MVKYYDTEVYTRETETIKVEKLNTLLTMQHTVNTSVVYVSFEANNSEEVQQ